jgi:hypothetical protein
MPAHAVYNANFPIGMPNAVGAEVAEPKNALTAGHHNESYVAFRPISENVS